jgi:aryl-alcohol dehydrogenase-like predicted oxidoreductase
MKYVEVGGVKLSAVGLGTWQFGSRDWAYGERYATETAPALVSRALELGVNLFDTAEIYAFGRSERILGQALAGRRDEAFIATKLLPVVPLSPIVERRARGSARRLGVDHIDLYQVHWPNPVVPVARTMAALGHLLDDGTVRHVGVSNYPLARWQEAESALGRPVLSDQVRFNLVDRRPQRDLVPWAQANDRLVIAYSPLAQGLLSGRYDDEHPATGIRSGTPAFLPENLRRVRPLVDAVRDVAASHRCSPTQVALAWLLRQPNVVVIPGASSVEQLESNVAATEITLSDDEDRRLVQASEAYLPLRGSAMVQAMAEVRGKKVAARVKSAAEGLRR